MWLFEIIYRNSIKERGLYETNTIKIRIKKTQVEKEETKKYGEDLFGGLSD